MDATNTISIQTELVAVFGRRIRSICYTSIGLSRTRHKLQLQRTGFVSCGQIRHLSSSTGELTTSADVSRQMSTLLFLGSSSHLSCRKQMRARQHLTHSGQFGDLGPEPNSCSDPQYRWRFVLYAVLFSVSSFPQFLVLFCCVSTCCSKGNPSIYGFELIRKYSKSLYISHEQGQVHISECAHSHSLTGRIRPHWEGK